MKSLRVVGNHSKAFKSHGFDGQNAWNIPVGMGWCSVVGESGQTTVVQLTPLMLKDMNMGVFFQSTCPVDIAYSLANPGQLTSLHPVIRDPGPWTPVQSVAPGDIVKADQFVFTAMRVTLKGDGALYIGVL